MATITADVNHLKKGIIEVVWAHMASGDVGSTVYMYDYPNKMVVVRGNQGGGSGIYLKGTDSADTSSPTGWGLAYGNALNVGATVSLSLNLAKIVPQVISGDGSTDITVAILAW